VKSEEERLVKKRLHGRWKKVVSVLACIVVFCTTYALILPAITKEKATDCGIEEHQHGEECFSEENELICTKQEHTHGPECYSDETEVETDTQADAGSEKDTGIAGQMQGEAEAGMAVAAEADAVSETEMEAMVEQAAAEVAPIAEGSASITGTEVSRGDIGYYQFYLIITADPVSGKYYALSSSGKGIPVDYNSTTKKVTIGSDINLAEIQWFAAEVATSWGERVVQLKNVKTGEYLDLNVNKVTGTSPEWLTPSRKSYRDSDQSLISNSSNRYLAFWESTDLGYPMFGSVTSSNSAVGVRFVGYVSEDIPVEGADPPKEAKYDFPNYKKIDYLGDGEGNSDTTVQGEDLYRLYLDINGTTDPIDLLVVVDRSSSMKDDSSKDMDGDYRYRAVNQLLNGSKDEGVTETGLIPRILNANPQNKIAVCSFKGKVTSNDAEDGERILGSARDGGYTYEVDSDPGMATAWYTKETYNKAYINVEPPNYQGTNYEAGLYRANAMFDQVENDKNKKIMIFISDGVPTYYIDQNGNRQGNSYGGDNAVACGEPSKRGFDAFRKANPDVIVHTIGIASGFDNEALSGDHSPEVLKYMAEKGGGSFVAAKNTGTLLSIAKLIYPNATDITDTLSPYVEYYGEKPDLKVVRSHPEKGTQVLYENNKIVQIGDEKILESVAYDPSTRKVTAKFDKDFIMQSGWTYTVSFNVKATQKAYDDYAKNSYLDADGVEIKGDKETDYTGNETSSEQLGFNSNTSATVGYAIGDKTYVQSYDNPVIQADKCKVILTKKNDAGDSLPNVSFKLKRGNTEIGTYTTGADGKLEIPSTALTTGNYTLEEAVTPEGYLPAESKITFSVEQGMITHGTAPDSWTWETDPEKNILTGNNYVKNNTYEYGLALVNHMQPKKLLLKKVDADGRPLEGAVFTLYKDCSSDTADAKLFRITAGDKEKTVWGTVVQAGLTSEGAQAVLYEGELGGGTYYLVETSAPDGYHRLSEPVVIKVAGDGVSFSYCGAELQTETTGTDPVVYSAKVQNVSGTRLPETGGPGRGGYITGGLALMLGAGILLYDREVRKRKGAGTR